MLIFQKGGPCRWGGSRGLSTHLSSTDLESGGLLGLTGLYRTKAQRGKAQALCPPRALMSEQRSESSLADLKGQLLPQEGPQPALYVPTEPQLTSLPDHVW